MPDTHSPPPPLPQVVWIVTALSWNGELEAWREMLRRCKATGPEEEHKLPTELCVYFERINGNGCRSRDGDEVNTKVRFLPGFLRVDTAICHRHGYQKQGPQVD